MAVVYSVLFFPLAKLPKIRLIGWLIQETQLKVAEAAKTGSLHLIKMSVTIENYNYIITKKK